MRDKYLEIDVPLAHQMGQMFDEIRQAVDDLEAGALVDVEENGVTAKRRTPTLGRFIDLASAAIRDGYPTESMRASAASSRLDEDGFAIPPISDPVGELVAGQKVVDPIRAHVESAMRGLTGALGDIRMARASLIRGSRYAVTSPGQPGCASHAQLDRWVEVFRDGRCGWCYKFWLVWRRDPTVELLQLKDEGRLITQAMIKDSFRPAKRRAVRR